jgi:hypothetical protein
LPILDQLPDAADLAIPSRSADYDIFSGLNASFNVRKDAGGQSEVDDNIDFGEVFCDQRSSVRILGRAYGVNRVPAMTRNLFDQRSGFATAQ